MNEAAEYVRQDPKEFRRKVVNEEKIISRKTGKRGTVIYYKDLARYIVRLEKAGRKKDS